MNSFSSPIRRLIAKNAYKRFKSVNEIGDNMNIINELISKDGSLKPEYIKARDSFWEYCKLRYPKFYKDSRPHLKNICDTMQALYEGRIIKKAKDEEWQIVESTIGLTGYIVCKKMMLNVPPRHGKSFAASLFSQWIFGKNNENKIITSSYNETLASRFGKAVRDGIDETKIDPSRIIFNDVFPDTHIKYGDASSMLWSLEGQFFNYLATSFGGTVTGVGCNIGVIDDQIKNSAEAHNENLLQNHYDWYTDTFLSRLEEGAIQIIIMTRWSTKDICGRLLVVEPEEWYELKLKACINKEKGEMLCPELLSFESYLDKTKPGKMSVEIALANYQQEPVDVQGRLYTEFKTYTDYPRDQRGKVLFQSIISYTDTADTGADFTCTISGGIYNGDGYITDVYYSDKPMEITEPDNAKLLVENNVNIAFIESNNGGRGFARAVERIIWEKYRTRKVVIKWFHQSQNKISRIMSNSSYVMERIYFPVNWGVRWPEFYKAIMTYQAKGKNKHDCAADALTGFAEKMDSRNKLTPINRNALGI